jgi:hypothetical protein
VAYCCGRDLVNGYRLGSGWDVLVVVAWWSCGCDCDCGLRAEQLLQPRYGPGARDKPLGLLPGMIGLYSGSIGAPEEQSSHADFADDRHLHLHLGWNGCLTRRWLETLGNEMFGCQKMWFDCLSARLMLDQGLLTEHCNCSLQIRSRSMKLNAKHRSRDRDNYGPSRCHSHGIAMIDSPF